ncbi:MAG: MBL fold metallo-hydrolase [Kiritimatiellia bacterium]
MQITENQFYVLGARGSTPVSGHAFLKHGGSTTCFACLSDGRLIIIDAGTGISRIAGQVGNFDGIDSITLFFTHFHMDHLIGLPDFLSSCPRRLPLTMMADPDRPTGWRTDLTAFIGKPYWPVGLTDTYSTVNYRDLPGDTDGLAIGSAHISWMNVPHPQQCLAYRIALSQKVIAIATDAEYTADSLDGAFLDFCRDSHVLVFDAQYTDREYADRHGWGHSTWRTAAACARMAHAGQLVLTHHDPERTDTELEEIEKAAQAEFRNTSCASENTVLCPSNE